MVPVERVYIAASMAHQSEACRVALMLADLGIKVTSRWIRRGPDEVKDLHEIEDTREQFDYARNCVTQNMEDLLVADTLLLLSSVTSSTGGYHTELGFFLAKKFTEPKSTNILVVGRRRHNVFYWHHDIIHVDNIDTALVALKNNKGKVF